MRGIAALTAEMAALKALARDTTRRNRQRDRLTDRKIAVLKTSGFSADGGNLYLDAWNLPSKNWALRYSRNGRAHDCRKFRLDQLCERLIPG